MKNIMKKLPTAGIVLSCLLLAGALNAAQYDRPGLLVLSHGSAAAGVNDKVEAMVEQIRKENNNKKAFYAVENAFLEVGTPTAKTGVEKLQAAGCDAIIVVPFFTSQDEHTQRDIPVVMGLSSDAEALAELKEEGIELAAPKVPVVISKTLNETNLLEDFVKSELRVLSQNGRDEALVVISLEKNEYNAIVVPQIEKAVRKAAKSGGIKKYRDVYSWQDETFWQNVMPAVKEFSKEAKRVIAVSIYTTRSAQSLYENASKAALAKSIDIKEGFGKAGIVWSVNSLTDYRGTPKAVLELAEKSL
ncbi:MAG: CbiX/SirB N-terminal domain-containing protein [Elusimicrobiota bacterium]|jgi:hypothetical protein|nr:CbiX/SirB N-terminal domain-containing protein [Elusimicrobiota bacterium]